MFAARSCSAVNSATCLIVKIVLPSMIIVLLPLWLDQKIETGLDVGHRLLGDDLGLRERCAVLAQAGEVHVRQGARERLARRLGTFDQQDPVVDEGAHRGCSTTVTRTAPSSAVAVPLLEPRALFASLAIAASNFVPLSST